MEPVPRWLGFVECEYCNQDTDILYGWHGDVWCKECILKHLHILPMTGALENAPSGHPVDATYEQPYIFQTPDGSVLQGIVITEDKHV